jgi:hypothetical protein
MNAKIKYDVGAIQGM